jgi:hypothetical protein
VAVGDGGVGGREGVSEGRVFVDGGFVVIVIIAVTGADLFEFRVLRGLVYYAALYAHQL